MPPIRDQLRGFMDQAERVPGLKPFVLPPSVLADLHDDLVRTLRIVPERRGLVDEDARADDIMQIYRTFAEHLGEYEEEREPDQFLARRIEAQVYCEDSGEMLSVDAFVRQRGGPTEAAKALIAVTLGSSLNTVRRRLKQHEPTINGIRRERTEAMLQAFFGLMEGLEAEGYRLRGDRDEPVLGWRPDIKPEFGDGAPRAKVLVSPEKPRGE